MKLESRVVVIRGAGIGRACARKFAKEGTRLVVADINRAAAGETVAQLKSRGRRIWPAAGGLEC
jgi:NAD(P)-dependent dehydrogenase (short-subunit alcohol dehydrogenase family)